METHAHNDADRARKRNLIITLIVLALAALAIYAMIRANDRSADTQPGVGQSQVPNATNSDS